MIELSLEDHITNKEIAERCHVHRLANNVISKVELVWPCDKKEHGVVRHIQ